MADRSVGDPNECLAKKIDRTGKAIESARGLPRSVRSIVELERGVGERVFDALVRLVDGRLRIARLFLQCAAAGLECAKPRL
ncbi:hypothetical protein O3W52_16900 [Ensifer psoraleae]|uniref:Transposase n=1 Tax=Sinorhizobium psoraleae TaxID=520838 RepID=A0ABT4KI87_9HYPH|nr:hypothetical protein [Sinorhizobium psoraleae]MCZ4091688.1 hypothetical protein [Sinorhizobium psoraleae]